MVNLNNEQITTVGSKTFETLVELKDLRTLYIKSDYSKGISIQDGKMLYNPGHKTYHPVKKLPVAEQKRILITGGAGFVGSHLVDRLMIMGHLVTCLDNYYTGNKKNVEHWIGHPNFTLVCHDVTEPFSCQVDQIYHLACPASPPHYQKDSLKTIQTGYLGTFNMLEIAKSINARFLLASTSEIYGDPDVHPQQEAYWGNVNPIGPRACYDEAKRIGETLTTCYATQFGVETRIVRIFNTFGPRMNPEDGRVVSNFIIQALRGESLTVYGDGEQTRSFQYVHDLVDGLIHAMNGKYELPINLGNPHEFTIMSFAEMVQKMVTGKKVVVNHLPPVVDDPRRRKPDISTAKKVIDWEPRFSVEQGVLETIEYFKNVLEADGQI